MGGGGSPAPSFSRLSSAGGGGGGRGGGGGGGGPIEEIEYKKEIQKNEFHKNTNYLMETSNTTLYNQKNENSLNDENFDDENDGPTLVFDDFDQSADLDVPAYIRKQNR